MNSCAQQWLAPNSCAQVSINVRCGENMSKIRRFLLIIVPIVIVSLVIITWIIFTFFLYQRADLQADVSVSSPKFNPETSPRVSFDSGHGNFHDINTTYAPFAELMKNDGIILSTHEGFFTKNNLQDINLLIIVNATLSEDHGVEVSSAFTEEEIYILTKWIQDGGSLLLIADHDPFGSATSELAEALGVGMSSVWTVDSLRFSEAIDNKTWLEFSEENKGLGQHSILQNEIPESAVRRVITFTGQSLSFDSTWISILQLSPSARNYFSRSEALVAASDTTTYFAVPNQSQLIARKYGNGRIVIAGEAAMFTAQEVRIFLKSYHAGFNYNGYDNKKLVLNIIHWLLHEID